MVTWSETLIFLSPISCSVASNSEITYKLFPVAHISLILISCSLFSTSACTTMVRSSFSSSGPGISTSIYGTSTSSSSVTITTLGTSTVLVVVPTFTSAQFTSYSGSSPSSVVISTSGNSPSFVLLTSQLLKNTIVRNAIVIFFIIILNFKFSEF